MKIINHNENVNSQDEDVYKLALFGYTFYTFIMCESIEIDETEIDSADFFTFVGIGYCINQYLNKTNDE